MSTRLLLAFPLLATVATAQIDGIANGDFLDGLKGWTTEIRGGGNDKGVISGSGGFASFREGSSTFLSLRQDFRVPANEPALSFTVPLIKFDRASPRASDRIEVSLLDPTTGRSVVATWKADSQAFLSVSERELGFGAGVQLLGARILQDIRGLSGRHVRLRIDMFAADDDKRSLLFVDDFEPAGCDSRDRPVLTKGPVKNEFRVPVRTTDEFKVEFAVPAGRTITKLDVEGFNLPGLTWSKPTLGNRASVVVRFAAGPNSGPHPVRFTATNDCTPTQSTSVTVQLYAVCTAPALTKAPPNREVRVAANTVKEFEIEFAVPTNHTITKLDVKSFDLPRFTWSEPKLGSRASVVARFAPDHTQTSLHYKPVVFTATNDCIPPQSVSVTIKLYAVELGCGLLLGGKRTNVDLGNGDILLVQPALTYVFVTQLPAFPIPNDRRLSGLRLFSQVFMGNQLRTHDPLMLSNGLEIILGERATPYGSDRFMRLRARAAPKLGGKLEFDVAIR